MRGCGYQIRGSRSRTVWRGSFWAGGRDGFSDEQACSARRGGLFARAITVLRGSEQHGTRGRNQGRQECLPHRCDWGSRGGGEKSPKIRSPLLNALVVSVDNNSRNARR